jgi:prepilin-type N-terminal cleavage/methylation domain-containing protein
LKKYPGNLFNFQKGFTLIETVVYAAILGGLAAILLVSISGPTKNMAAGEIPAANIAEIDTWNDASPNEALDNLSDDSEIDWEKVQSDAEQAAEKMESRVIQTAMDTMMIREGLSEVQATSATEDMTAFPEGSPLYPVYLRDRQTRYQYSCDTTGQVSIVP